MKRKVIQIAESTQLISLPRKWCKAHSIMKGDELELEEQGDKITVSTKKGAEMDRISLDITDMGPMIKRVVAALYKAGYDEMELKFSKTEELRYVQDVMRDSCIGFEIVEQGKNYLIARKISDAIYDEFETVLRRTFLFLLSMSRESLEAIKKDDTTTLNNIILMDASINKFTDFCRRILNKRGYPKFKKTPPVYYIVEELEKIGDEYAHICRLASEKLIVPRKESLEVYAKINTYLQLFYELFYKFDLNKIKEIMDERQKINEKLRAAFLKTRRDEIMLLFHLKIIFDKIFDMNGPLIATSL